MLTELAIFADTVRSGEKPTENLETSLHTFRLYDAIEQSVENGGELLEL